MRRAGRGHYISDPRVETAAGIAAFIAGAILLHDAYEKRARPQPVWLRPFAWW